MKSCPETAIIIRARNEERWIGEVLERLKKQTYQNFETIVVDSGSTDQTCDIVRAHNVKLLTIRPEEFTYPYAINFGIKNSTATKYLVILSAHSLPIDNHWLQRGIDKFSLHKNVLGVYGPLLALPDGTFWDKLFYGIGHMRTRLRIFPRRYRIVSGNGMGVLGFTNAIIRRDLWEQYPINEEFAGGGEDNEWATYWLSREHIAIKDLDFTVRHSHYLSFRGWQEQLTHWKELAIAQPFKHLSFRKDGSHDPLETER